MGLQPPSVELIENGRRATGKGVIETQMVMNLKTAIKLLMDKAGTTELNRYMLMNLHRALAENLLPKSADEGRIRRRVADIGRSVCRTLTTLQ